LHQALLTSATNLVHKTILNHTTSPHLAILQGPCLRCLLQVTCTGEMQHYPALFVLAAALE
jgi:hypothetical protein